MTYIPTWAGFVYLAVVLDVYSRKVVGWAFGQQQTADLVIQALNMALITRKPQGVIHHSDQGSQPGFNWSSQHSEGSTRSNTLGSAKATGLRSDFFLLNSGPCQAAGGAPVETCTQVLTPSCAMASDASAAK